MLIRGVSPLTYNFSGGRAWAVSDPLRGDLTRPVLGHLWVTGGGAVGPNPAAPYFESVVGGNGVVTVQLRCTEEVTGFELSWNSENIPDLGRIRYNTGGAFEIPVPDGSDTYLFGRTVRDGAGAQLRSEWTAYGTSPAGYSPWELVWNDDIDRYTADTTYPGLQHIHGTAGDYVYVLLPASPNPNRVCCHSYYTPQSLSVFNTSSGVQGSYWGAKHQTKTGWNYFGSTDWKANEVGFVFGARVEILTSYLTETYYVLAGQRKNNTELYFRLYSVTGAAFTELAISGNVHSFFPSPGTFYEVEFKRVGDDFYVIKSTTQEEVWHTTDDSIPPSLERVYTGIWMSGPQPLGGGGTPYLYDYWRVYRMVAGLNPAAVDPGHPFDGLQPQTIHSAGLSSEFALSEYVLQASGNDAEDYTRFRLGDNPTRQPKVKAMAFDPVTETFSATDERDLALDADVIKGSGTIDTLPIWTGTQELGDSLISQPTASTVLIGGDTEVTGDIIINNSLASQQYFGNIGDYTVIASDTTQTSKGIPKIAFFLGKSGEVAQFEWNADGSRFGYNVAAGSTTALVHLANTEDIPAIQVDALAAQTANLIEVKDSAGTDMITVGADGELSLINTTLDHDLEDDANTGRAIAARIDATAPLIADYSGETGTDVTLATVYLAVKFVPAADMSAGGFSIWAKTDGTFTNPTATLTGYIYSHDSGTGTPSGTSLGTATAIKYGGLTSSYAEHQFYLSTLVALTAGTTYWLVFKRSAVPAGANLLIDSDTEADYGATSATGAASSWSLTTAKLRSTVYARSPVALAAYSDSNVAVRGYGYAGIGVYGWSRTSEGVYGTSAHGYGGRFVSASNYGVWGQSTTGIAIFAYNPGTGYGLNAQSWGGSAGYFTQSGSPSNNVSATCVGIRKQTGGTVDNTGHLLEIIDNPTTSGTVSGYHLKCTVGSTERVRFDPRVVNGASAIGYFFDTANALSTAGAKLMSLRNNGTEKLAIAHDGVITPGGYNAADGTAGATANVDVAKVGGGTRTLSFKNGLFTGYTDS